MAGRLRSASGAPSMYSIIKYSPNIVQRTHVGVIQRGDDHGMPTLEHGLHIPAVHAGLLRGVEGYKVIGQLITALARSSESSIQQYANRWQAKICFTDGRDWNTSHRSRCRRPTRDVRRPIFSIGFRTTLMSRLWPVSMTVETPRVTRGCSTGERKRVQHSRGLKSAQIFFTFRSQRPILAARTQH